MAILFMDGFDNTTTPTHKWTSGICVYGNSGPATRFSTGKWALLASTELRKTLPSNYATLHCGAAFYFTGLAGATIAFADAGSTQVNILVNADGSVSVQQAAFTVLGTSAPGVLPNNSWNHIGFKATINNTTGTYDVWVNGVNVLSATGANTRNSANNYANQFVLAFGTFDDAYVGDISGSAPDNDFIGDTRIETQFPNGAGNYTQWTPSTGSNWQNVDDNPPNDDTDYNSDATVGHIDTYTLTHVTPLTGTIYARQTNIYAKKDDATLRQIAPEWRHSTTDSTGANITLPSSYAMFLEVFGTNPGTSSAWTISDANSDELGVKTTT